MPRTTNQALLDAVAEEDVVQIDLWTFELPGGTQRWTTHGAAVTIGADTWSPGPVVGRGGLRCASGVEVSTLDVTLAGAWQIGGTSIAALATAGSFDDVKVIYERLYLPSWDTTPTANHRVTMFVGYLSDEGEPGRHRVKLVAKSILARAEEELPRRTVGPMCPWPWANATDGRCGIVRATWQASDTVAAGSTARLVKLTTGTSAFLVKGAILTFSDGAERVIVKWDAGTKTATLDSPLAAIPPTSSSVTISRGCDKTMSTCNTTYSNLVRFGGFPGIPKRD